MPGIRLVKKTKKYYNTLKSNHHWDCRFVANNWKKMHGKPMVRKVKLMQMLRRNNVAK